MVEKAKKGLDKTSFEEVDWKEVPRYDSKGNKIEPEKFKTEVINKHGKVYFEQNYGNSFLGSSMTLVEAKALDSLRASAPEFVLNEKLKVFEEPIDGHAYIMGVDSAKDGADFFSVQILDVTNVPFKQVACANLQVNYLVMTNFIDDWAQYYNWATVVIENNDGSGQSLADMLVNNNEYPNVYYQTIKNKRKEYPGFRTTKDTREQILNLLKMFLEKYGLTINDLDTINELYRFELINGKYQASTGHDDLVMSLALCFAPFIEMNNFEDYNRFVQLLISEQMVATSTAEFFSLNDSFYDG